MDAIFIGERSQSSVNSQVARSSAGAVNRVPIVRVASSGISQVVDARGTVVATAPFPGIGDSIAATVVPAVGVSLPVGRFLARLAVALTVLWGLVSLLFAARDLFRRD